MQETLRRILTLADTFHSYGTVSDLQHSGRFIDLLDLLFHAVKNLTTAEGRAVTWRDELGLDNDTVYQRYMLMNLHGKSKAALAKTRMGTWEYDIVVLLYKSA